MNMSQRGQLDPNAVKYQKNGIKVQVIGQAGVGKTTLIQKLCEQNNQCLTDNVIAEELKALPELQYLEVSLEDMPNLRPIMIEMCDVFILVYAVNDTNSFDFVTTVATEITQIKGENVPMMVIANEHDVESHTVDPTIADCVVTIDFNAKHHRVSAKHCIGVNNVFYTLLRFFGVHSPTSDKDDENCSTKGCYRIKLPSIFQTLYSIIRRKTNK